MKKWILKAVVQKAISYLPGSSRINYFFQKYVTKGVYLTDAYFEDRLSHAKNHLDFYRRFSDGQPLARALELGTGWYPVVPVAMFLTGAEELHSVDISMLTHAGHLRTTVVKFLDYQRDGRLDAFLQPLPERLAVLQKIADTPQIPMLEILETLRLRYHVRDARSMPFPDGYFDLVNSNNTFEHIYPDILAGILREFSRLVRPGGVQSHFVDMSDHFAHFDRSINIYHFLRFTERQWAWIDNSVQPQNRLRFDDFLKMYENLGISLRHSEFRPGSPATVRCSLLVAPFRDMPPERVAISHCHLVS